MAVMDILIYIYIYIYYAILISIVHGVELKVFAQPSSCRSSWFSCWDGERPRKADILLQTLDARDPKYCRCAELEAWATQNLRCRRVCDGESVSLPICHSLRSS